ncbi:unnamed protein product [Chironomus riparius]|uniref:Uncharacterized protein n=1 Tax=Chironomus riparius TaxID=315576 RepID=A0A9N9WZP6_9DIPT|nr:unnamed protein product [Chironomus riparius]
MRTLFCLLVIFVAIAVIHAQSTNTAEDPAAKVLKSIFDFSKSIGDGISRFYADLANVAKSSQK